MPLFCLDSRQSTLTIEIQSIRRRSEQCPVNAKVEGRAGNGLVF